MIPTLSELTCQRMLSLTQAALHGTIPDEGLFADTGETDWSKLFEQCVAQGVMILSLEGAMRLPKSLQPPLVVKLRWIASVEAVKKRYQHQLEAAESLTVYFRGNNVRMLLLKGFTLSRLYPVASSREFGDIDIFLCGKAKEGDVLLKRINKKHVTSTKHTSFSYRGIPIENHHTLLHQGIYKKFRHSKALEKQLVMMLEKAGLMEELDLSTYRGTDEILLFPPAEFDVLYVTLHMLTHLPEGIVLRHLCDLTVLFTAYQGKIDFSSYREILSNAGLLNIVNVLISLAVQYLGLNPEYAPPYECDLSLEQRIWNDLLHPVPLPSKEKPHIYHVFLYKIRLLRTQYWKYQLVFPGQFVKGILYSIFFHVRYPHSIGKIK